MLDTKIVVSWNALMVRGLIHAGEILGERGYVEAGLKASTQLLKKHREAKFNLLDDYAYLIWAAFGTPPGEQAKYYADLMRERFGDAVNGGFFFTESNAADIIVRQKIGSDNPLPSGNGVAALVMLGLAEPGVAAATLRAFGGAMENVGEGMSALLQAAMEYVRRVGPLKIEAGVGDAADRPLSPAELAEKVVAVRTRWTDERHLELRCKVLAGFHILADRLRVGTVERGAEIELPAGVKRKLAFDEAEQEVLEGEVVIGVGFENRPPKEVQITLVYQACDDSACLPEATRRIEAGLP
jgi:uncharacterized protein YyaL (SSP411 family)